MTQFLVKSPAVGVKVGGKVSVFYRGGIVTGADVADAERLVKGGHLERLEVAPSPVVAADEPLAPSVIPPKDGPGSGKARWHEYAASVGVDVPGGADRAAVIEALVQAGQPTE